MAAVVLLYTGVLPRATPERGRLRVLHRGDQQLHDPATRARRLQNKPQWGV